MGCGERGGSCHINDVVAFCLRANSGVCATSEWCLAMILKIRQMFKRYSIGTLNPFVKQIACYTPNKHSYRAIIRPILY